MPRATTSRQTRASSRKRRTTTRGGGAAESVPKKRSSTPKRPGKSAVNISVESCTPGKDEDLASSKSFFVVSPSVGSSRKSDEDTTGLDSVEKQTEQLSKEGTIQHAASHGDRVNLLKMIDQTGGDCLKERDAVGATPLHILCLFGHSALAMEVVQMFPERGLDVYEGDIYQGENCLHIAIVQHNMELAKCLVETCGCDLFAQEAVGTFFLPAVDNDSKTVYYGGYPLSFAVASHQQDFVEYLVMQGADMTLKDTVNGNTAMHISILYELPDMYELLGRLWKERRIHGVFDEQLNHAEQSSMTFAAATGTQIMFEHVMNARKQVQWRYGPITCAVYPLKEFDVLHKKPGDRYGALEYLVEHEHLDLISSKHVLDLIEKKWNCFAKDVFRARFARTVLFITSIFFASMLPRLEIGGDTFYDNVSSSDVLAKVRLGCECLAFILTILKMREEFIEIRFHGIVGHFTATGAAVFENVASAVCITMVYLLCGFRLFCPLSHAEEDAVLAGLNIAAWVNLLWFFVGMSAEVGIFVIILHKMLTSDLKTFSLISFVFLGGFSTAFHLLGAGVDDHLGTQVVSMVATILGDFDVSSYQSKQFPRLATALALLYISLLSLVLVNMLIAKMGDTYSKIAEQAEKRWNLERARLVIDIERSMSATEKEGFAHESMRYWIVGINPDTPDDRYIQVEEYDKLGEWSSLK